MCRILRGRTDIHPDVQHLPHPAARLLGRINYNGVSCVLTTEPWSRDLLDERFNRGAHTSVTEHAEFLGEEFSDFMKKGFWLLLPYDQVKDLPGLRLSPIGVVPQRQRIYPKDYKTEKAE